MYASDEGGRYRQDFVTDASGSGAVKIPLPTTTKTLKIVPTTRKRTRTTPPFVAWSGHGAPNSVLKVRFPNGTLFSKSDPTAPSRYPYRKSRLLLSRYTISHLPAH